ncbi:VID27 cytoplasmic protein-domain-containing protein [Gymnopilus junonius]|uniref:VID27 cytoplasmic protein-domain-containing protein n=1 Tax=Gymnopilus junonius TaxID=109634 RepID=A0A9P5NZJ8_GYMJU|nr:VID27 cytoplasmic protein-domain-containing protein [Gymnopilus junonius]
MNIFRSLIGKVWQDPNAAEVVKISSGQLYLVRPGNIRTSRECIYNECMATIRRLPSVEHNFQLVITKVYEDGDQDLLEDEDETDEEKVFLISEELEFHSGETEGEPNFIWRDLYGDVDEFYEFVATGTNAPTRAFFETCMYRAMYERKYKKSADNIADAALEEFVWHPPAVPKSNPRRKVSKKDQVAAEPTSGTPIAVDDGMDQKAEERSQVDEPFMSQMEVLFEQEAELYLWDKEGVVFRHQGIVKAKFTQRKDANFVYFLVIFNNKGPIMCHQIKSDMNQKFSQKMFSLTWNFLGSDNTQDSWLLRFNTEEDFANSMQIFTQCLWQFLHQTPWGRAKPDEQQYVLSAYDEDVVMKDVEDEDEDEDEIANDLDPDEEPSDDSEAEDEDAPKDALSGERNSQLTVGYKGDRSYVVRGNNIGVFNHSNDHSIKYYATISNIATPKGKSFKPKNVMLHDQDTKMILQNPTDPNSLFAMDIERGKVVEEWKVHEDITVDHIAPDNKFAPTTREQTLVGVSHNSLFRIDPRVSGAKLVDSQYKQYAGKNKFSGVTTTASGKLAVASEKGDIRLFDSIGKNAKTALPPIGDPIIGIDVTANGRYIVATTETYLIFIDTLIGEGRYAGQLGFDRSFPATSKPKPKRLHLNPQHVAYMGGRISFTPARFNQVEGQEENAIITSTGQFVIAWDLAKVKKGKDQYEIKKYEDHVVQDNFKFGDDKEIIVALSNNVLAVNKKNLKRPTRHSLSPAQAGIQSHSSIVNSPY